MVIIKTKHNWEEVARNLSPIFLDERVVFWEISSAIWKKSLLVAMKVCDNLIETSLVKCVIQNIPLWTENSPTPATSGRFSLPSFQYHLGFLIGLFIIVFRLGAIQQKLYISRYRIYIYVCLLVFLSKSFPGHRDWVRGAVPAHDAQWMAPDGSFLFRNCSIPKIEPFLLPNSAFKLEYLCQKT